MNPVTEDIKDVLVGSGLGEFAANKKGIWGIFIAEEPSTPDSTITLYDTGGRLMPYHNRVADEAPNFQVRIRANSYLEANKKMNQVIEEFDRIGRFLSTDELTRYENVLRDGISIPMGKDENERHLRVQNFKAFRRDLEE